MNPPRFIGMDRTEESEAAWRMSRVQGMKTILPSGRNHAFEWDMGWLHDTFGPRLLLAGATDAEHIDEAINILTLQAITKRLTQ